MATYVFEQDGHSVVVPDGFPEWLQVHYRQGRFYEQDMLSHIRASRRPGIIVDVGANAGNHTLYFAKICQAKVHAFEPNRSTRESMISFIDANRINSVTVHPIALSDHDGTVEATFVLRKDQPDWKDTVPCKRLDDALTDDPISVIKIDVEGAEEGVLVGTKRILQTQNPTLYVEAFDDSYVDRILAVVTPYGYALTGKVFNATPTYEIAKRR